MDKWFHIIWTNWISVNIINWNPHEKEYFSSEEFVSQIQAITNIRWWIISTAISIEDFIDNSITYILFDTQDINSELFQNIIMKGWGLTFDSKWKILREITERSSKTKDFYNKTIITSIKNCIEIRNIFAHWNLVYDFSNRLFFLESISKWELSRKEITQEYLESSANKMYECINSISMLVFWYETTVKLPYTKK